MTHNDTTYHTHTHATLRLLLLLLMMAGGTGAWGQTETTLFEYGTNDVPWTAERLSEWTAGGSPTIVDNSYVEITGGNGSYATSKPLSLAADAVLHVKVVWRGCSNTGRAWSDSQKNGSYFRLGNIVIAQNDQDQKHGYTFDGLDAMNTVTTFTAGSYRVDITSSSWLLIEMEINTATNKLKTFTIKSEDGNTTYVSLSNQTLTSADYSIVEFGYQKQSSVSTTNKENLKSIKITSTPICEWSESSKTINITDVGQNNPNVVSGMPTLTVYDSDAASSITRSTSDNTVAVFWGNDLHFKKPGTITVNATCGTYTASYDLTVNGSAATTSSATFSTTHKYDEWKLTSTGTLTVPTTVDLDYIDMSFGYTGETAVAVSDGAYGNVLKIIDTNGYSHANTTGDVLSESAYGGTFYKFVTTATGTLQVTGRMSSPVLLNALTTSSVVAGTTYDGTTFTAANLPAGTYYLYNSSYTTDGSATATAMMNGFRFTLPEQSLSFAWADNPVKYNGQYMVPGTTQTANVATNASVGGGNITYTSSDPSVATVDASTGAFTMLKGGHTVITATAAAVPGTFSETSISYALDLNVDKKWVFDNGLGANNAATSKASLTNAGLTLTQDNESRWAFVSGSYVQLGVNCCISIPDLTKGQMVEIVSHADHSNNIALTNALDINTHTDKTSEGVKDYKSTFLYVKDDGNFTMTGKTSNDTYIHAIYVYTAAPVTATMEYNSGVNLQQGGGNAFVTDVGSYTRTLPSTILDSNIFGNLCEFSSDNTALATVNTSTGELTPVSVGTVTITAKSYPTAEYAATYAPVVVTASVTVESSTAKSAKTIVINDLMYSGMASATDNGLDRVIPNFEITVTGGDKVMSNVDGSSLIMNGGTIRIAPRYASGHAQNVYITNAVAYFSDGTAQLFSNSSNLEYIDIKKRDKEITHIYVEYNSSDNATDVSTLLNNATVTPLIVYAHASYNIEKGRIYDYIYPTVTPKNLRGIGYWLNQSGTIVTVDGIHLRAENIGSAELWANYPATTYFNAVAGFKCMTMVVVEETAKVPAITIPSPQKLYLDAATLYPSAGIDGFVFIGETLEPIATIDDVVPSGYSIIYSTSDKSIAYPNNDASKIHTAEKGGLVTITATFMPDDPTTNPVLAKTYQLYVLDGMWDFRNFKMSTFGEMTSWSANGKGRWRNNGDFEPFIKDGGVPLDLALGLQSKYMIRLMYDDHGEQNGFLELWGSKDSPYYQTNNGIGSVLRIPVRKGMVVEINARCSGEHADMYLDGLNELDNTKAATTFYVDGVAASQYFIANRDGYFDISNPSVNLYLYINYIRLTSDIEFKYGTETYVKATNGAKFTNPILNQGDSNVSFEMENIKNAPAASVNSSTGEVTLGNGVYGQFEVVATALDGELADKSAAYTATVLAFEVSNHNVNISSGSQTFNLQEAITTLDTGNTFGDAGSAEKTAAENEIKNKVTFSIVSSNTIATLSGNMLTIEDAGTVILKATLGSIEQVFYYSVTGAAIGYNDGTNDIAYQNPVIENDATSYTIKIIDSGSVSNYKFHLQRMKDGAIGDIKSSIGDLTFPSSAVEYENQTLTISGFNNVKKGGVIPIYASYEYGGATYELEGTLTIAYTEHVWRFQHNFLTGMDAAAVSQENSYYPNDASKQIPSDYGTTHGLVSGLADWTSTTSPISPLTTKTGLWGTGATIDEPTDNGDHSNVHDWKFVRKMGVTHPESAIIYYYNHNVAGSNSLIIPETEGLVINSTQNGQQLGVEMDAYGNNDLEVKNGEKIAGEPRLHDGGYFCSNLMMLRGGRITIPKVKPKQWIEVRWTRHRDDLGERLIMDNLSDVNGKYINEVYKIGNCYYNIAGNTSTYMFQVPDINTPKGDGTYVDGTNGYVDATFEIADNTYISIQQITLHPVDWDYKTIINSNLKEVGEGNVNQDLAFNQVIPVSELPKTITLSNRPTQNAPNAPATWEFSHDATLTDFSFDNSNQDAATITYNGGWGKAYITLTSYSQNMKYVANRKTWVLTFGMPPAQTYPYTWDFTKYFSNTKTNAPATAIFQDYNQEMNSTSETEKFTQQLQSWQASSDEMEAITTGYDDNVYKSYFVDNAQLVSTGTNGPLPETAGLGFSLTDKVSGGLTLDMQSTVATGGEKANNSGETWRSGQLTITGGGTIIVPKPEATFSNFYVYVRANTEPTVNAAVLEKQTTDVDDTGTEKQYRYHFLQDADAVLTFSGDATVYAIGVTDQIKALTTIGTGTKEGWATESRNRAIDYTLTDYLTTNAPQAYVVEDATHASSTAADNHCTTVKMGDTQKRYVVPHTPTAPIGLVLRQKDNVTADYSVPLFVPAVTTASDATSDFTDNLMMANLHERVLTSERENGTVDTNGDTTDDSGNDNGDYTRFILAKRYMTWRKENGTLVNPTGFESKEAAVFYRLHLYGGTTQVGSSDKLKDENGNDISESSADELNTLGPNKAYLLLPTSQLPAALWNANEPSRRYVPILGVSDMDEDYGEEGADGFCPSDKTYNLRGQAIDTDGAPAPGIYIRNGKKIIIKR